MGTKNNPGKFDCYENAEPDEPMFVLLARDKHAPTLVWLWAALRELDRENAEVVQEARHCMVAMIDWAHAKDKRPVGIAQAVLVGVFEMMRAINGLLKDKALELKNSPTTVDMVRQLLCLSTLEDKP